MSRTHQLTAMALPLWVAALGCASWDNPAALAELWPEVEFEIEAARIETFEEVEIHVHASEHGARFQMHHGQLEIQHTSGGPVRIVQLQPEGDGYAAHAMFFEEGEHHLHFMGAPHGHSLMAEFGEHELHVHRQHRVIGPYWVEMEVTPAPVFEHSTARIHILVFELLSDGSAGDAVGGLDVEMAIHAPGGDETTLAVEEEETGEYEAEYTFGKAGVYELHVEILVGTEPEEGEFHIPVLSETDENDAGGHDTGGDGHGH